MDGHDGWLVGKYEIRKVRTVALGRFEKMGMVMNLFQGGRASKDPADSCQAKGLSRGRRGKRK